MKTIQMHEPIDVAETTLAVEDIPLHCPIRLVIGGTLVELRRTRNNRVTVRRGSEEPQSPPLDGGETRMV